MRLREQVALAAVVAGTRPAGPLSATLPEAQAVAAPIRSPRTPYIRVPERRGDR